MNRFKIIIAEDNPDDLELLCSMLAQYDDMEITCVARDGAAALSALRQNRFDLIVLDIDMPQLTGIEVLALAGNLVPPYIIFYDGTP